MPTAQRMALTVDAHRTQFNPRSIPGLLAYFDADDTSSLWQNVGMTTPANLDTNPVARWSDRSGNAAFFDLTVLGGLDANRAIYRATGVNSLPAVDFVAQTLGGNSMLLNTSFAQSISAFTVMFTGIIYETSPNLVAFSMGKNGTNPWQGGDGHYLGVSAASTTLVFDASEDGSLLNTTKTIDNTNPHLFTWTVDAATPGGGTGTVSLYVDGGTAATDTGSRNAAMTIDGFSVGDFYAAGGIPARVKVRQMVIYSRRLSASELNAVGVYLASRTPAITVVKFG